MVRPKMTVAAHISCQHLVRLLQISIRLHCRPMPKQRIEKSLSSFVDERPTVIALVPSSISSHGIWRECWQPAGSNASHWVARVGQARRCEASAWMSRRPSSWSKLSTIVERPGQPVALIPRKRGISCVRASVLPSLKNRDTFADTSRATLSCTGGQRSFVGTQRELPGSLPGPSARCLCCLQTSRQHGAVGWIPAPPCIQGGGDARGSLPLCDLQRRGRG